MSMLVESVVNAMTRDLLWRITRYRHFHKTQGGRYKFSTKKTTSNATLKSVLHSIS